MKRTAFVLATLAALVLAACQGPLGAAKSATPGVDPIGGITIRVSTSTAAKGLSRAITGVTKMVVTLESTDFPSIVATAAQSAGTFTAQIASVKPGAWTVKASLFDANDVEKYFGQAETVIQSGVANSVNLAVSATGSVGLNVIENTTLVMVPISGGNFNNGTATMTVSDFQMSQTEVTQAQYQAVTGINPSNFTGDLSLPVDSVTWYDAVEF